MLYILFDKTGCSPSFISQHIQNATTIEVYSPSHKIKNQLLCWIVGVLKVLSRSKNKDTIICWFDFQAVICYWFCKLLYKKRKIICLNILLKDKKTIKNKIVSILYRKALLSPNFKASITSICYGKWLNHKLNLDINYTLIHDVYHKSYEFKTDYIPNKKVFCGGRNGRDWDFIIKLAKELPDIQFVMIMPETTYKQNMNNLSPNIEAKYEVPYHEFMKALCTSSIVCLPLNTEAPAGLIVLFQAAANHKLVLTTDTVTTREYINKDRGILLDNKIDLWIEAIQFYMNNDILRKSLARNLHNYLKIECSEKKYIDAIKLLISC